MSVLKQNVFFAAGIVRMTSGCLHMLDLLSGLAARGCEVALVCESISAELSGRELPFDVLYWRNMSCRHFLGDPFHFGNICAGRGARLVHVHGGISAGGVVRALRHSGLPVVFTPHGGTAAPRAVRRLARLAQRIVAMSEYRREYLVNVCHLPRENIRIIPPGIETAGYREARQPAAGRIPVIGAVSPLEAERGQDCFLRAAAIVLKSGREAEFVLAGDGRQEEALRKLAATLGIQNRVTFATGRIGYKEAISLLDVFVRPAVCGGMGYTILLAMALGKAIVATATDDVPEVISEGETGLMVAKGDPQSLADAMIRLLDDPALRQRLGSAARHSAAAEFSLENLVQRTLAVYEEAIEAYSRNEEARS